MDNFESTDTTISVDEWCGFNYDGGNRELDPGILVVTVDSPPDYLEGPLEKLERIVVVSVDFNDGRIFSIGRQIRLKGYNGRLSIAGNVISDQYSLLHSCGFDEVIILDQQELKQIDRIDAGFTLSSVKDFSTISLGDPDFNG